MHEEKIVLGHGSGGRLTQALVKDVFLSRLGNPIIAELSDAAVISYEDRIAFTTDSFVVQPLFFHGGDIGKLAVCGTVNDLVVQGAQPEYLSLALIIEEGLEYRILEKVADSLSRQAQKAGVRFIAGDVKVVEKGSCDKLFINTSGVGRIVSKVPLSFRQIREHDQIILTSDIGRHGLAVLAGRKTVGTDLGIKSDCASLDSLLLPILRRSRAVRFVRDATRGGVATVLNEIAQGSGVGIVVSEDRIPVSSKVRAACELFGFDPLYLANEGSAVLVVAPQEAPGITAALRRHPLGRKAAIIGTVTAKPKGLVISRTTIGTQRLLEMTEAEIIPRIC